MFQASFKVQSAGAIIAAVMWATAAIAPALGQVKHEEIAQPEALALHSLARHRTDMHLVIFGQVHAVNGGFGQELHGNVRTDTDQDR